MVQNQVLKWLLSPISALYGIAVATRNLMYDAEVLKSSRFSVPIISVGNLSIGGAGKTPHIEYLIQLLNPYINVATLSRGYNRSTKGFRFVRPSDTARTVGDEPLMYARKHRGIAVAVSESRAVAIPQIVGSVPQTQAILLDDAFQHRSVDPYINILLTPYETPYTRDSLLPGGRLREWKSSSERADVIIVTKCPDNFDEQAVEKMTQELAVKQGQQLYFTRYRYHNPYSFYNAQARLRIDKDDDAIVLSAIANTSYLMDYLKSVLGSYVTLDYADHYNYTDRDIDYIIQVFKNREKSKKYILTTEKDAMRLDVHRQKLYEAQIPVYILPLSVEFVKNEESFNAYIKEELMKFSV